MTHANPSPSEVEVRKRRGPSLVWLVPILAAVIGVGIAYDQITSRGPTITLLFEDGSGLEAGKTKIKYKAVEVGVIKSVDIEKNLEHVIAKVEMGPSATKYLSENTVFWKVSPQISLTQISGLETLVSGIYIGILPRTGKKKRRTFSVLAAPPASAQHPGSVEIELHAAELGSVQTGSPLVYQGQTVGEVTKHALAKDGRGFEIRAWIGPEYAHLVTTKTLFWDASGLDFSLGAGGLQVHTASLATVVQGGIAFETPAWVKDGAPIESGARFRLHPSRKQVLELRERVQGLNVRVEARDGSVAEGAPVFYRKHKVGHVGESRLSADATSVLYDVHIEERYAPLVRVNTRFWNASGVGVHVGLGGLDIATDSLESILEGGFEFATPDRPGAPARDGALYALHDEAEPKWLAWAPRIPVGPEGATRKVAHVLPSPRKPKGLEILLESFSVGSLKKGDPVYYRQIRVGEVGDHELTADAKTVRSRLRIEPRYATLVRSNSRFWNVSGIGVHFGLGGLDIRTGSLETLLAGGVAFATPDEPGPKVEAGTVFPLHPKAEEEWERWSPLLPVGPGPAESVEHAIHADTHRHLFRGSVESEALAPEAPAPVATAPADEPESAPAPEKEPKKPGLLRRIFRTGGGDGDDSQEE
jgi:paraquat-inducible protein B